jgi:hypothetical protein
LLATLVAILFFSYGHLQTGLLLTKTIFVQLGRNWVLIPIYLIVFIVSILTITKKWVNPTILHQLFNIIALTLIIFPAIQILGYYSKLIINSQNDDRLAKTDVNQLENKKSPDVYYIILDSYTRQDELLERYGFDNSAFISELKNIGFYIADCSFTNYPFTSESMAASLNMDYLYNTTTEPENSRDKDPIYRLIKKNRVREILENQGYKIVAFNTGITSPWLNWDDADIYYYEPMRYITDPYLYPFESLFLDTTILRLPIRHNFINLPSDAEVSELGQIQLMAKDNQELLNNLVSTTAIPGPKFVYFHILIPHPPFIYLPDGAITIKNYVDENTGIMRKSVNREEGYINSTQYINNQMLKIIRDILDKSDPDPIIIVQGDHAFSLENRYPILNAYFFPDGNTSKLYRTISPINTFRVLFDQYFGMDFQLLPDQSMWYKNNLPYSKKVREDLVPNCR